MLRIRSVSFCDSSVLIKFGAKVFDDWSLLRLELDLCLAVRGGARFEPLNGENDWLRIWTAGLGVAGDDVKAIDLGLLVETEGAGEDDCDSRVKGLPRHFAPFVDMLLKLSGAENMKGKECEDDTLSKGE